MGKESYTSTYFLAQELKNFYRYEDADPPNGNIKESPMPYPYIRKGLIKEMGSPDTIRVTIIPMLRDAEVEPA